MTRSLDCRASDLVYMWMGSLSAPVIAEGCNFHVCIDLDGQ